LYLKAYTVLGSPKEL